MEEQKTGNSNTGIRVIAILGTLLGPLAAVLHETAHMDLFGGHALLNLWIVIISSVVGAGIGIYAILRGAPRLGIANLMVNTSVLAIYLFLVVFFGFGGSR